MHILYDELSDSVVESHLFRDWKLTITRARLFKDFAIEHDIQGSVYILSEKEALSFKPSELRTLRYVIYCGPTPIRDMGFSVQAEVIRISELGSVGEAFIKVMDAFENLSNWHDELLFSVLGGRETSDVLRIAAVPLMNPIALFDSSNVCIGWAGSFPSKKYDAMWQRILEGGYGLSSKTGPMFKRNDSESNDRVSLLSNVSEEFPKEAIAIDIYNNTSRNASRRVIGTLSSVRMHRIGFTAGQISIMIAIADCLGGARAIASRLAEESDKSLVSITKRLLLGENVPVRYISSFFQNKTRGARPFQLIVVDFAEAKLNGNPVGLQKSFYTNSLTLVQEMLSAGQITLLFSNKLIIVGQSVNSPRAFAESVAEKLFEALMPLDFSVGVSETFDNYLEIRSYFDQSVSAAHLGSIINPSQKLHFFNDYAIEYLLENSQFAKNPQLFCNSTAMKLFKYDQDHGTDCLKILESFYKHNGNKAKAADELYMHRNTLTYRLDKIKSIVNLTDLEEDTLFFLLSCRALRWLQSNHELHAKE